MNQNSSQNIQSYNKHLLFGRYHLPSSGDTKMKTKGPQGYMRILCIRCIIFTSRICVFCVCVCYGSHHKIFGYQRSGREDNTYKNRSGSIRWEHNVRKKWRRHEPGYQILKYQIPNTKWSLDFILKMINW